MQIGGSLFLFALGAILAFAVEYRIAGIDITVVGFILMAVGAVGLLLTLVMMSQRNNDRAVNQGQNPPPNQY